MMAARSKTTNKSKVASKKVQKKSLNIWYALVAVLFVAAAGIGIIYYSQAGIYTDTNTSTARINDATNDGLGTYRIFTSTGSTFVRGDKVSPSKGRTFRSGAIKWVRSGECYTFAPDPLPKNSYGTKTSYYRDNQEVSYNRKSDCNL